jgi:hypothetical protein
MLLLVGRAMYIAGQALLQLHRHPHVPAADDAATANISQEPAIAAVTAQISNSSSSTCSSSSSISSSSSYQPGDQWESFPGEVLLMLLGCMRVAQPAVGTAADSDTDASTDAAGCSSNADTHAQSKVMLQQLQQQLFRELSANSIECVQHIPSCSDGSSRVDDGSSMVDHHDGSSSSSDSAAAAAASASAEGAEAHLKMLLPVNTAQQLVDLGSGICVHFAAGQHWCCANPGCTNLADALERQLVAGKGTVCSACRSVRLCGPACNKAYWKAGHKQVCALFKQRKSQPLAGP